MTSQAGSERTNQKRRTRQALLAAARELLGEGATPSFQDIADRAGISRATAYRYYSDLDVLLQEAALDGIAAQIDRLRISSPDDATVSGEVRVERTVSRIVDMVLENEALFRVYLRGVIVGDEREPRGARRVRWLEEALGDALPRKQAKRVVQAISLLTGIETVIVTRDVLGLDDKATRELVNWTARAILAAALKEATENGK
ncbi:MAG: TetR/AcrR family transcriptional regulator [Devosia sp.]